MHPVLNEPRASCRRCRCSRKAVTVKGICPLPPRQSPHSCFFFFFLGRRELQGASQRKADSKRHEQAGQKRPAGGNVLD